MRRLGEGYMILHQHDNYEANNDAGKKKERKITIHENWRFCSMVEGLEASTIKDWLYVFSLCLGLREE
jgi:hypothetical protein